MPQQEQKKIYNPFGIQLKDGRIMVYTSYKYIEVMRSIGRGYFDSDPDHAPALVPGAKPGAWSFPQEQAAKIADTLQIAIRTEKNAQIDPRFFQLVNQAQAAQAIQVKVDPSRGIIKLKCPQDLNWVAKMVPTCKPAIVEGKFAYWKFEYWPGRALEIAQIFSEQAPAAWRQAIFDEEFSAVLEVEEGNAQKKAHSLPEWISVERGFWKHQVKALEKFLHLPGCLFAWEMGAGKTKGAAALMVARKVKIALIVCPKSAIYDVWGRQLPQHAPDYFEALLLDTKETVKKKQARAAAFVERCRATGKPGAVVINYDILNKEPFDPWLKQAGFDCVVWDEIHNLKSAGGKRSWYASQIADSVTWRIGLTGTPMPHSPVDLYAIFRALDKSVFGTSKNAFLSEFCIIDEYKRPIGFINQSELTRRFYSISDRVYTRDVVELPEKVVEPKYFKLSNGAAKKYNDLWDKMYTELERAAEVVELYEHDQRFIEGTNSDILAQTTEAGLYREAKKKLTVTNILTQLLRFQQITGGYLPDPDNRFLYHRLDEGKEELLEGILASLEDHEPVVVFYRFSKDCEIIKEVCNRLGRMCLELSGKKHDLQLWKEDTAGEYPILAVQLQAGSAGIDLTRAHYGIYYSFDFNLGNKLQSEARIYRPGQKEKTFIYYLLAEDTVDMKIQRVLEGKQLTVEGLIGIKPDSKLAQALIGPTLQEAAQVTEEVLSKWI